MKRVLLKYALTLAAFAAGATVFLLADPRAPLTGQSPQESSKAGGLRSFEIVPLETVSETSANASVGDLNGDGIPTSCWPKAVIVQCRVGFFSATAKETSRPASAMAREQSMAWQQPIWMATDGPMLSWRDPTRPAS